MGKINKQHPASGQTQQNEMPNDEQQTQIIETILQKTKLARIYLYVSDSLREQIQLLFQNKALKYDEFIEIYDSYIKEAFPIPTKTNFNFWNLIAKLFLLKIINKMAKNLSDIQNTNDFEMIKMEVENNLKQFKIDTLVLSQGFYNEKLENTHPEYDEQAFISDSLNRTKEILNQFEKYLISQKNNLKNISFRSFIHYIYCETVIVLKHTLKKLSKYNHIDTDIKEVYQAGRKCLSLVLKLLEYYHNTDEAAFFDEIIQESEDLEKHFVYEKPKGKQKAGPLDKVPELIIYPVPLNIPKKTMQNEPLDSKEEPAKKIGKKKKKKAKKLNDSNENDKVLKNVTSTPEEKQDIPKKQEENHSDSGSSITPTTEPIEDTGDLTKEKEATESQEKEKLLENQKDRIQPVAPLQPENYPLLFTNKVRESIPKRGHIFIPPDRELDIVKLLKVLKQLELENIINKVSGRLNILGAEYEHISSIIERLNYSKREVDKKIVDTYSKLQTTKNDKDALFSKISQQSLRIKNLFSEFDHTKNLPATYDMRAFVNAAQDFTSQVQSDLTIANSMLNDYEIADQIVKMEQEAQDNFNKESQAIIKKLESLDHCKKVFENIHAKFLSTLEIIEKLSLLFNLSINELEKISSEKIEDFSSLSFVIKFINSFLQKALLLIQQSNVAYEELMNSMIDNLKTLSENLPKSKAVSTLVKIINDCQEINQEKDLFFRNLSAESNTLSRMVVYQHNKLKFDNEEAQRKNIKPKHYLTFYFSNNKVFNSQKRLNLLLDKYLEIKEFPQKLIVKIEESTQKTGSFKLDSVSFIQCFYALLEESNTLISSRRYYLKLLKSNLCEADSGSALPDRFMNISINFINELEYLKELYTDALKINVEIDCNDAIVSELKTKLAEALNEIESIYKEAVEWYYAKDKTIKSPDDVEVIKVKSEPKIIIGPIPDTAPFTDEPKLNRRATL